MSGTHTFVNNYALPVKMFYSFVRMGKPLIWETSLYATWYQTSGNIVNTGLTWGYLNLKL